MLNWNLEGKKALITGGTKGIGEAIVSAYVDLGAEVITVARNAATLPETWSGKVTLITGDLSDADFRNTLSETIGAKWGKDRKSTRLNSSHT